MAFEVKQCENPACANVVPPSKNSGVERKFCSIRCRTRVNGSNYYHRMRAEEAAANPQQQPGETRLCRNERCQNVVPPSKGPRARIYCSIRCRQRQSALDYYHRQMGRGDGKIRIGEDGKPFVFRVIVKDHRAAERLYKEHLTNCVNSTEGNGKCPARWDPYDWKRQCQIHAVLREDWDELRRWEVHHVKRPRTQTTSDGYWIYPAPKMPSINDEPELE